MYFLKCENIKDNDAVKKELGFFIEKLLYNENAIRDIVKVLKDIIRMSGASNLNDIFILKDKVSLLREVEGVVGTLEYILKAEAELRDFIGLLIDVNAENTIPGVSFYEESRENCLAKIKVALYDVVGSRKYILNSEVLSENEDVERVVQNASLILKETEEIYRDLDFYLNRKKERMDDSDAVLSCQMVKNDSFDTDLKYSKEEKTIEKTVEKPNLSKEKSKSSKLRGAFSWISSLSEKNKQKKTEVKNTHVEQFNKPLKNLDYEDEVDYCITVRNEAEDKTPEIMPVVMSEVQFSAVVKKKAELAEYIPVNIIMYNEHFRKVVDELLDETVKETKSGYHNVAMHSKIRVVLSSKDIELDDCEAEGVWQGKFLEFGFVAEIPENYAKKQILFCASVYVNDLIATKLKFFVDVKKEVEHNVDVAREDIKSAFVSYASQDRERVASVVQGMKKARPDLDVFMDVETLRSGENWREALKKEIDKRTVLFLCWSKFASNSEWVDFEWRYAMDKKGTDYIDPVPIEPPELCPPPVELSAKHFNDRMLYMIKALEYMNKDKPYLIIKETNEKICVNKNSFIIGRIKGRVDYVSENKKVGRIHAEILCEGDNYFIVDFNSVNKTYVDGEECVPEEKVQIFDGTVITLADMEMIFKLPERA